MPTLAELEVAYFVTDPNPDLPTQWQPFDVHRGHRPQLILDGKDYFGEVSAAINGTSGPEDKVWIAGWVFDHNLGGLGDRLVERAEAGVDVRVLLWCNPWARHPSDSFQGSRAHFGGIVRQNLSAAVYLRNKTINAAAPAMANRVILDPSGPALSSWHQKTVVVEVSDVVTAWIGGIDFASDRFAATGHIGTEKTWHDAAVVVGGEPARDAWKNFEQRWFEARTGQEFDAEIGQPLIDDHPEIAPFVRAGDEIPLRPPQPTVTGLSPIAGAQGMASATASTQVLRSVPTHEVFGATSAVGWQDAYIHYPPAGIDEVFAVYRKAIGSAKRFIYIEDQFLGKRGRGAGAGELFDLLAAAMEANDELVLLLVGNSPDGHIEHDDDLESFLDPIGTNPDWGDRVRAFARPHKLLTGTLSGVDVHSDPLNNAVNLHSKVLLVDDEFMAVGSANFMHRSMSQSLMTANSMDGELQVAFVSTANEVRDSRVALWADMALGKAVGDLSAQERSELENADTAIPVLFELPNPSTSVLQPVVGWTRIKDRS